MRSILLRPAGGVKKMSTPGSTRVTIRHDGWGEGGEWDQALGYFDKAWGIVLRRLECRFENGPIDWDNPPKSV